MIRLIPLLLAGAAVARPVVQEPEDAPGPGDGIPDAAEVEVRTFRPENLDPHELFGAARQMIGGEMRVRAENGQVHERSNMQLVGETVVLFDVSRGLDRKLDLLKKLDREAAPPAPREVPTTEYRPEHISVQAAHRALGERGIDSHVLEEAGLVVLRGETDSFNRALGFLRRIDVPTPQVLLTSYLIAPAGEADPTLPADLTAGLSELTGTAHFERRAMGLVRTSVEAGSRISILLSAGPGGTYDLQMVPATTVSASEGSVSLNLRSCGLVCRQGSLGPGTSLFETSTRVELDRYTVIGAAGVAPYFVVLHATTADG